jgi:acetoin utilization protein AcuC
MKIPMVYSHVFRNYDFGLGHPFRGDRFSRFLKFFHEKLNSERFEIIEPKPADDEDLSLVHTKRYINRIKMLDKIGGWLSPDTPISPGIYDAARSLVGSSIKACKLSLERGLAIGFGGAHHAGKNYGGGFCLFNDVAIATEHLKKLGIKKIMILDSDAHAGNGTCDIFYSDPSVLFLSIHQDPRTIYPGIGFAHEIGSGKGRGYTVNIPMPVRAYDKCYEYVLNRIFVPLVKEFEPDVIIRNGGSDPHFADGLTNLGLTLDGLKMISKKARETAEKFESKYVDLILSGYNQDILPLGWTAILSGVAGVEVKLKEPYPRPRWLCDQKIFSETKRVVHEVKGNLKEYWDF